ncbi:hypothetical protein SSOG_04933 [Streptomyces himastatinicus ATCC 53653]|uniref:Uncharacterized protein n=2 Tax=Streptomyces TaxID=1883 RepID=D9WEK4_9ACTN|nr:Trp biosynthesis-associated membrane protein [Streptomyces himastatinicus]EFL25219.1 hypothetical protein SSOG_04933 [Streptomyces himastatinicus ATCC 53653]
MSEYSHSSYAQTAPPPMHSAGTPGGGTAAAPPKKFAVLGAVGAVIALAGSCVNWVVSTSDSADGGVKGIDGDGIITLIIALVGAVLMLAALATKKGVLYLIGAATGLATAIVLAINMASPERLLAQKLQDEEGVSAKVAEKAAEQAAKLYDLTPGPGIYIALIGALMILVFGVLGFLKTRSGR